MVHTKDWLEEYDMAMNEHREHNPMGFSSLQRDVIIKPLIVKMIMKDEDIQESAAITRLNNLIWDRNSGIIKKGRR